MEQAAIAIGNAELTGQLLHNSANLPRLLALRNSQAGKGVGKLQPTGQLQLANGGPLHAEHHPDQEEHASSNQHKGKGKGQGKGQGAGDDGATAKRRKNLVCASFFLIYIIYMRSILYIMQSLSNWGVIGKCHIVPLWSLLRTNEMPEEVYPAAVWLVNKLTGDLQSAKMWPVKLSGVKHQEALSLLAINWVY